MHTEILDYLQDQNIVVPLLAALFGGSLSMAGSVVAVWRTNRHARIERENEREELLAGKAYEAFFKLLDGYNFIGHLNREIDQMFDNASEDGDEDMEPSAKVMAIVGAEMPPEQIHASEVAFLIGEKNAELLNDVHLI